MKKKGLIISTIVMVVVLIASLTTATYAWFNATSEVKVNDINLSITSNAAVNVGVRTSGARGAASTYDNYYYETLTSSATNNVVAWDTSAATPGLGQVLTFGDLALGVNKALGTSGGSASSWEVDASTFDFANLGTKTIVKAPAGATSTAVTTEQGDIEVAIANQDYLHAIIGVEANKDSIKGMYVKVEVATTDAKSTLGMNAALHFYILNAAGQKIDFQPFGGALAYGTPKSTAAANENSGALVYDSTSKQITSTFYFWVGNSPSETNYKKNGAEIVDFEIYAFIEGADQDCNNNALGTSCTISISFDGTTDTTKLADGTTAVSSVKFLTLA